MEVGRGASELFDDAERRGAGAGIKTKLLLARLDGLVGDELYRGLFAAHAHGKALWAGAGIGQILEGGFYDAVLQGVKGDHAQAAAGLQHARKAAKGVFQRLQFVVYRDAKRLKRAPCGVGGIPFPHAPGDGGVDDVHQLTGGFDGA